MSHNPCESRQEEIVALAIGELDPDCAGELLRHLETCPECRGLYEEVVEREVFVQATFAKISKAIQSVPPDPQPIEQAVPLAEPVAGTVRRSRVQRWKWTPMKVLALAALFVLAATGLFSRLHLISPSFGATFASVLQRIQKARTVTYKRIVHVEGQEPREMHDMAMHPGRLRTVMSTGRVFIQDFAEGKEVRIDPAEKSAELEHKGRYNRERLAHLLEWIATAHEADGVYVGQEDMDGRKTNVFRVNQPFEQIVIWADAQTDLPVRIEKVVYPCLNKDIRVPELSLFLSDFLDVGTTPASSPTTSAAIANNCRLCLTAPGVREQKVTVTMTDFAWDVALDESLLQVAAPEGYQVTEVDFGDPPPGEESLIASLRFWAETSNGAFPADINMLLEARRKLVKKFKRAGPAEQDYADALKMARVVVEGMLFAQQLKSLDNWHYAGKDVKSGEANKPLCWWKDDRAATYRVVYGDLTVRDIAPAEVPTEGP